MSEVSEVQPPLDIRSINVIAFTVQTIIGIDEGLTTGPAQEGTPAMIFFNHTNLPKTFPESSRTEQSHCCCNEDALISKLETDWLGFSSNTIHSCDPTERYTQRINEC